MENGSLSASRPPVATAKKAAERAIFTSVVQALRVSFEVIDHVPSPKSGTAIVCDDMMRRHGVTTETAKDEWSVSFAGLDPLEIRAQCQFVCNEVERLQAPERDTIHARFTYQLKFAQATRGLCDYVAGSCDIRSEQAILALIQSIYRPVRKYGDKLSLRAIEKDYGVPKSVLHRALPAIKSRCFELENLGMRKLAEVFHRREGLIGEPT